MIIRKIKALALASVMLLALIPINSIEAGAVEALTSAKVDTAKEQANSTKIATKDGWQQNNNLWYFYKDSKMQTGWVQDSSKWFYLNSNGAMAYSTEVSGYYLGANGAWIPSNGSPIYTGGTIKNQLLDLGYFTSCAAGDNIQQLYLREGGKANDYTHNQLCVKFAYDGNVDYEGTDIQIVKEKNDVDTNSEFDQLIKVIMPDYVNEVRDFVNNTNNYTGTSYGAQTATASIGGRTITKYSANLSMSVYLGPVNV